MYLAPEEPAGAIHGVRTMRMRVAIDIDRVAARSSWGADLIANGRVLFGVGLLADSPTTSFVESTTVEDASGRTLTGFSYVFTTCERREPCRVEFTITLRFTEAFVHRVGAHQVGWGADLIADDRDVEPFGDGSDCSDGLRDNITAHILSVELDPEDPDAGPDAGTSDGGVPDGA